MYLVDLAYSLGIYAFVLLYYRVSPSWTIVFLPLLIVLTLIATLSLGVMLAALTVFYRDVRHIVPFLTQILDVSHAGDLSSQPAADEVSRCWPSIRCLGSSLPIAPPSSGITGTGRSSRFPPRPPSCRFSSPSLFPQDRTAFRRFRLSGFLFRVGKQPPILDPRFDQEQ